MSWYKRHIPVQYFVITFIILSAWYIGTEMPYVARNLGVKTVQKWCAYTQIGYSRRLETAYRIVNPPQPCDSCMSAFKQTVKVRKDALKYEKLASAKKR